MRYQIRVRKGVGNYVIVEVTKKRLFRSPKLLSRAFADLSASGSDLDNIKKAAVLAVERAETPTREGLPGWLEPGTPLRPTDAWRWRHGDA